MKKLALILALSLILSLFAGCAGTPVIYQNDCTCPTGGSGITKPPVTAEGALKTGLCIATGIGDSTSADGDQDAQIKYDVTMVAVLVDDNGVIQDCIIDGIAATVKVSGTGTITSDLTAPIQTKNELGSNYGMVAWGGAIAEWDQQAAALAAYAIGKTVQELKEGAVDETGKAPAGSDLASSATIYLGGYVSAIEAAVANAKHAGAQAGDTLKLAAIAKTDGTPADATAPGSAQLDVDVTALTMNGDTITSCVIDSVQAKVEFDGGGSITTDPDWTFKTKTQLGSDYGMVAWGKAIAEWDQQAASFAAYVTGKTPAQVAGIAVNEKTAPTDADLAASVTIAIAGFQALIAKAAAQ